MNTVRHYFTSDDLDDLEILEEQLEAYDVRASQIHVLSNDETGIANHVHLHAVQSLLKNDVVHCSLIGAMCGLVGVIVILGAVYMTGLYDTNVGWVPFVFLSVVVFGFCTWEGGFIGFQEPNYHYRRFEETLRELNGAITEAKFKKMLDKRHVVDNCCLSQVTCFTQILLVNLCAVIT